MPGVYLALSEESMKQIASYVLAGLKASLKEEGLSLQKESNPDLALLGVADVAHLTGRSESTIYRWLSEGRLPDPVSVGGCKKWSVRQIRQYMRA